MPIKTDSDEWNNGRSLDPLEVHVTNFLLNNPNQAFHLDEITIHVIENHSDSLFLLDDVDSDIEDWTYELVKCRVAAKLEELDWRQYIESQLVEKDGVRRVYFTNSDRDPIAPIAAVYDIFPPRFDSIESNVEMISDRTKKLSEEIENLQYRLYQVDRK